MEKQLTSKQKELVEVNHNLIYKFASIKNVSIEEYYDILAIGLCKAAMAFDENKGKFSTVSFFTDSHPNSGNAIISQLLTHSE